MAPKDRTHYAKTIITGIKCKSDKLYEYSVERNEIVELFSAPTCVQNHSIVVYLGSYIIFTGGSDYIVQGKTQNWLFDCSLDPDSGAVELVKRDLPSL